MSEQPDLSLWHGPDNTNRIEIPVVLSVPDPEIEDVEAVVVVNKDGADQIKIDPADAITLYGHNDITVTPVEVNELPVASETSNEIPVEYENETDFPVGFRGEKPVENEKPVGFWKRFFGRG